MRPCSCYNMPMNKQNAKTIEYAVVESDNLPDIQEIVQSRLNAGWQLRGGVTVIFSSIGRQFYQAITRTLVNPDIDIYSIAKSERLRYCLRKLNIRTIEQLARCTESDLLGQRS